VILAKASASRPAFHRPTVPPAPAPPPPPKSSPVLKIAIVIAVVGIAWMLFRTKPVSAAGWYEGARGYEQAMAERSSSGKPVMVYFHTAWCGYCKRLDRDVFSTADFSQRYGASMLKVSINPEKGRAEASIAQQYAIRGYPTVFVVASNRTSQPIVGYRDAETFYARLAGAIGN
jgi:thiol:disulfide interchange protein